jgi:hypothetical protein
MKQSKKFVGVLLLGLMSVMMTASVYAKAPKVADEIFVNLYKETGAECETWKVDPATSIIPVRDLKWNAKVSNFKSSTTKVSGFERKPGTYYINFKANQYIRPNGVLGANDPGHSATVRFVVEQDGDIFVLNTKLQFIVRETPFRKFTVGSTEYANSFRGRNKAPAVVKTGVAPVRVSLKAGYDYKKIVYTNKKGYAHTFANGNKLKLSNLSKIEVVYTTLAPYAAAEWLGGYYKQENCSYLGAGCKRLFPVRNVATLTF